MTIEVRPYREDDFDAVVRIWREVGWIEDNETQREGLQWFLSVGHAEVAVIDGEAECCVHWADGGMRDQHRDLPMAGITAVTTSHIGRIQGLATRLTARAVAAGAEAGAAVAALGMFDQGFYDRLGFGTGTYDHVVVVDPATLKVPKPTRPPVRVGLDDWADVHAALLRRERRHGSMVLHDPELLAAELRWNSVPFGLGYRDEAGTLTHFFVGSAKETEHGPYELNHLAFEDGEQLLELLGVVRSLADQVAAVRLLEPPGYQLQDLIHQPFRTGTIREGSDHATGIRADAIWQVRILDLPACIGGRRHPGANLSFGLHLDDPIATWLDHDSAWRGVGGDYVVHLGETCAIEPVGDVAADGSIGGLPTVTTTINAFSRMWFGVRPASALAITDQLSGPAELLAALDDAIDLPAPLRGWDF